MNAAHSTVPYLSPLVHSDAGEAERVIKAPHNRARRALTPPTPPLPLVTLSMRADVQFFHSPNRCGYMYTIHDFLQENRYRISGYSIPCVDDYYHVEDACILGDTVVVAYSDGPSRVSLVRLREVSIRPKYFAYQ